MKEDDYIILIINKDRTNNLILLKEKKNITSVKFMYINPSEKSNEGT